MRINWFKLAAAPAVGALMVVALGAGCPGVDPQDHPPVANAGPDQTVAPGAAVTLSGSGSDPDGGAVAFAWSQTSGTGVTLSSTNTASTSFTAPATAGALTFHLVVTDTKGSSASDDVTVTVSTTPPPAVSKTLYVTNLTGNSVTAYALASPNDINGNIPPIANLTGANTGITAPRGLGFDAAHELQVGNDGNNSITSYAGGDNAANVNGNVSPSRNVQGAASAVNILRGIARQSSTDLMYVSDAGAPASIRVFAGASTAAFNGNLAPIRTITNAAITAPRGIAISGDELYIANEAPAKVLVYANASTLNGNVAPTRVITTATLTSARDVFIDNAGRLFVVNNGPVQRVLVYNNAATINGVVAPDVTLTVSGATVLNSVVTDSAGVGYISDRVGNKIYSYDNLATRNGTIVPDRTLTGAATLLSQPYNLLILE